LIFYDPADSNFGYYFGHEDGVYPPDLSSFTTWTSSYYVNPDLTSRAGARATTIDSSKRPSIESMTDKDLAINLDLDASTRSDGYSCVGMRPTLERQAQAALFNETLAKDFLPDLQIVWIAATQSMWALQWGKVQIQRQYEEHVRQKHQVRPFRFTEIEGANHFVHWDEPKKFWDATVGVVCNADRRVLDAPGLRSIQDPFVCNQFSK
jgi:pimeloyl-ACP methyl ester carboxylesterase